MSQESHHEAHFNGRITADVLKKVFLDQAIVGERFKFLAVGAASMASFAYEALAELGLDIQMDDHWRHGWHGSNLLYQQLLRSSTCENRKPSPLLKSCANVIKTPEVKEPHIRTTLLPVAMLLSMLVYFGIPSRFLRLVVQSA